MKARIMRKPSTLRVDVLETKQLYLYDSYRKEFEAKIQRVNGNEILLDQTIFHPLTGGVAYDTGHLENDNVKHAVLRVEIDRETKEITHVVDDAAGLKPGDTVKGVITWERRYRLMRLHTAAHLIAAVMYRDYDARITGRTSGLGAGEAGFQPAENRPRNIRRRSDEGKHGSAEEDAVESVLLE